MGHQSVARTGQQEHRDRAGINLCPEWDSKSRSQCSSDTHYTATISSDNIYVCLFSCRLCTNKVYFLNNQEQAQEDCYLETNPLFEKCLLSTRLIITPHFY
jgi:hypothetical protein